MDINEGWWHFIFELQRQQKLTKRQRLCPNLFEEIIILFKPKLKKLWKLYYFSTHFTLIMTSNKHTYTHRNMKPSSRLILWHVSILVLQKLWNDATWQNDNWIWREEEKNYLKNQKLTTLSTTQKSCLRPQHIS